MICKNCKQEITYARDHWVHALEVMGEEGNYNGTTNCFKVECEERSRIQEDVDDIILANRDILHEFDGEGVLVTGGAGFLGSYFVDLLARWNETYAIEPCQIYCLDTFITGTPERLAHLDSKDYFHKVKQSVTVPLPSDLKVNYILHFASIASPIFYRQHPIETIDANVFGTRNLLEYAAANKIKSMLFLSSSEIYGNPPPDMIPTSEEYWGNVSCIGPRACYDESKRLGETLCVNFFRAKGVPVKIARPFNVYGPGLRLDDKRIMPDLFSGAFKKEIVMFSDGTPTRSFCYVSDAIDGLVKILFSGYNGEPFNVGNDAEEISMLQLAEEVTKLFNEPIKMAFCKSNDRDYLTDNPQHRCPNISKIKSQTGYAPKVNMHEGLSRLKNWYEKKEVY